MFKYIGTEEQLLDNFFDEDWIRDGDMGWAHRVDKETKIVDYVDPEYAKKYEGKVGGLRTFIKDLIEDKLVIEIKE